MTKRDLKREIEALIKETDKNREKLRKVWQKVGELNAVIEAAQSKNARGKAGRKT